MQILEVRSNAQSAGSRYTKAGWPFPLSSLARLFLLLTLATISVFPAEISAQGKDAAKELSGEWFGTLEQMDNGEYNQLVVQLQQHGKELEGSFHTRGFGSTLKGTIEDGDITLFRADRKNKYIYGKLVGQDLQIFFYEHPVTMHPLGPDDLEKTPAYIAPPALHPVADNGLARLPPMGWNSWNQFKEKVDDATVRTIADAMVSSGMRDAGYIYLNIDDSWEGLRDAQGVLQPNHKFPDMKPLAAYVHSKGLKLGIYSSPGMRTCGGYPGSYGHEAIDAKTWASWGIDYLKYDWCSAGKIYKESDMHAVYQRMGDALASTGRPIVYSLCQYGDADVQTWGAAVGGNLWRTTADIRDTWDSMSGNGFSQSALAPYAGPGHWNDPDMLEVGNGHLTDDEYRTHMSLWSLLAAPLLAGNDLRSMTQPTRDILLNPEVIAVDQDSLGKQGTRRSTAGQVETWTRPLADGGLAVGIFNRGSTQTDLHLKADDLNLKLNGNASGRDLWLHRDIVLDHGVYSAKIPPHGVIFLRFGSPELSPGAHR